MFEKKHFFLFLGVYTALRVFSYFFGPETPLQTQHIVNTTVSAALVALVTVLIAQGDKRGWYLVMLEMILDGSGNYLATFGLTARTWFIIIAIPLYVFRLFWKKYWLGFWQRESKMVGLLAVLLIIVGLQGIRGYLNGHDLKLIIGDTLPYAYILYYFPLRELLRDQGFRQLAGHALIAAVVGNALMIGATFIGYSSGLFSLQGSYYHWFRDVAEGKITELPFHFYRLVLNEHLLLVPVILYFFYSWNNKNRNPLPPPATTATCPPVPGVGRRGGLACRAGTLLLIVLSINLTRIYLVALVVGLLALFNRAQWCRWFIGGLATMLLFSAAFTSIHLLASRGASLGWEIFGIRLQSIVSPAIEESSLSRLLLLPKILEKIQAHPLLGEGLGATVSVYSPVFKETINTQNFDWGYLEIITELGAVGLLAWGAIIVFLFRVYKKNQLPRWQLASFLALLTINITSPALFHILGITWLAILLAQIPNGSNGAS